MMKSAWTRVCAGLRQLASVLGFDQVETAPPQYAASRPGASSSLLRFLSSFGFSAQITRLLASLALALSPGIGHCQGGITFSAGPTATTPSGTVVSAGGTVPVNVSFTVGASGTAPIVNDAVDSMQLQEVTGGSATPVGPLKTYIVRFRSPDYDVAYNDPRTDTLIANLGAGVHVLQLHATTYNGPAAGFNSVQFTVTIFSSGGAVNFSAGPTLATPNGTLASPGGTVGVNVSFTARAYGTAPIVNDTVDSMQLREVTGGSASPVGPLKTYVARFRPPDNSVLYNDTRTDTITVNLGIGIHELYLHATTYNGATVGVDSAHFTVTINSNAPPIVTLTSPANNTTIQSTGTSNSVTVTGTASSTTAFGIDHTDVLVDNAPYASFTGAAAANISTPVALVGPGVHTVGLRAVNTAGISSTTFYVNVLVNRPPTVSMSAPTSGTVLAWNGMGLPITIAGSASDPDLGDAVAQTEVLVDGTPQSPPLTGVAATTINTTYTVASAGMHQIQLRSTDSRGAMTLSNVATVVADIPPAVAMSAPADGASLTGDLNGTVPVAVTGSASDSDGSVASIKLLVDGSPVFTATGSTISTSYSVTVGPHTFQLQAIDNQGKSTNSTISTINVTGAVASMTLPQINTPKAGSIQGQEDVSAGKATYQTSVSMPPGVNGMVPSVSLGYGGGTDIGLMGVGWSMSASSSIERCPPTIVQDGRIDTVRFTTADRLCLDGKRLQLATPIVGTCTVTPGAPAPDCFNTAYWSSTAEYRTEIESFVRVKQTGTGYQVYTKDGRIHFYGDTPDVPDTDSGAAATQVFSTQRTNAPTGTAIHTWMLRETTDRFGNAIDYTYVKDTVSGEFYPRYIRYGANANAGQAHFAKVQFDYGPRNDANVFYIAGGRADKTVRLSTITTFTDTNADGSSGAQALQYTINYDYSPSSGRSRVSSLVECGSTSSDCLPPTTFKYGEPNPGVTPGFTLDRGTWAGPPLEDALNVQASCNVIEPTAFGKCNYAVSDMFITADFNGDGVNDMITKYPSFSPGVLPLSIYINNGSGFNAPVPIAFNGVTVDSSYFVVQTGDFDGDGQTDILLAHTGPGASGLLATKYMYSQLIDWKICYSRMRQGNGFQCQEWAAPAALSAQGYTQSNMSRVYDFDGDGRDDIFFSGGSVKLSTPGQHNVVARAPLLCMSTGTGFSCNNQVPMMMDLGSGADIDGFVNEPPPLTTVPTDMDGDGRQDLASWVEPYPTPCDIETGCSGVFDYNGTGAWIRSYTAEGGSSVQNAFTVFELPGASVSDQRNAILGGMAVGDLNGDGYSDLLVYGQITAAAGPQYRICQGMGNTRTTTCFPVTFPDAPGIFPINAGDYDGDGVTKVLVEPSKLGTGINPKMCTIRGTPVSQTATCGPDWTFPTVAVTNPPFFFLDFSHNVESTHADFLDLSGNGSQDWILYRPGGPVDPNNTGGAQKPGNWHVYSPQTLAKAGEALDRMVQVTDGLGKKTQFVYALPGDSTVYSADALDSTGAVIPVTYPERRVPRMGTLVKSILIDNGQGGTVEYDYHYAGATRDMKGRGFLGFTEVDVIDHPTLSPLTTIKKTQWFSKTWPNIGAMTASISTYTAAGATTTIGSTAQILTYQAVTQFNTGAPTFQAGWQSSGFNTVCPYASSSTTSKWDIDVGHSLFSTTANAVSGLDAWCNPTVATATTSGESNGNVYVTTTGAKFNNDLVNWFIGQPLATAVTKTRGGACVLRRTSAAFDGTTGVQISQTIEPHGDLNQPTSTCATTDADSLYTLTTTFSRTNSDNSPNKLGLVRLTTQSWLDPVTQTPVSRTPQQVTAFESKGRFAQTVLNAASQSQTILYDDRNGSLTQHTDVNGLVTVNSTDAFGQETVTLDPEGNEHRHAVRQCDASCPTGATSVVADDTLRLNSPGSYTRLSPPTLTYHDNGGRPLRSFTWGFDGRAILADQRFDLRGRQVASDHPHFTGDPAILANTIIYDDLDRVRFSTVYGEANDSRPTETRYAGRVTTVINPKAQSKIETKDTLGLLVLAKDAALNDTTYGRDPFGNLNKVTDPLGNVVTIVYDRLGRRISLNDPDLGLVTEQVDPPGRTYWSQSPKQRAAGTSTSITFDKLDRMTHRLEPDLESFWLFDTAVKGVGELAEAYTWNAGASKKNYRRVHSYDSLGRPSSTVTTIDTVYTTSQTYDAFGRPLTVTHNRGATTRSYTDGYNAMGFLERLTNEAGTVLWQEKSQDPWGHEITAVEGALALARGYDPHTTNLTSATWAVAASNQERYSETLNQYDVLNNLKQRSGRWNYNDPDTSVVQRSYQDAFTYDGMNRLATATAWTQPVETFTYDAIGNLKSKTSTANGGAYTYPASGAGSVGPHAVQSIASLGAYTYDSDGNMLTAPNAVTATWTSFDMPSMLKKLYASDTFFYGPEHQRVQQNRSGGTGSSLIYAGSIEVLGTSAGITMKTYWPGGRGVTIDSPTGAQILWTPTDKLGNVRGYIDATGAVTEMLDYDAWGKRRNASGIGTPDSLDGVTDNKGFTGHEMLDNVDLVHMNGRVYDPLIGRFLTADPYVQSPENSQSYNRYTYVWNNPTNSTDPTGFTTCGAINATTENCTDTSSAKAADVTVTTHRDWTSAAMGATTTTLVATGASNSNVIKGGSSNTASPEVKSASAPALAAGAGGGQPIADDGIATLVDGLVTLNRAGNQAIGRGVNAANDALEDFQNSREGQALQAMPGEGQVESAAAGVLGALARFGKAEKAVGEAAELGEAAAAGSGKPSLTAHKNALAKVQEEVGKLPKGEEGKFGSPQAGNSKKGYRLDPPHDGAAKGGPESQHHFNWWDYSGGKRGSGGRSGAIPIVE